MSAKSSLVCIGTILWVKIQWVVVQQSNTCVCIYTHLHKCSVQLLVSKLCAPYFYMNIYLKTMYIIVKKNMEETKKRMTPGQCCKFIIIYIFIVGIIYAYMIIELQTNTSSYTALSRYPCRLFIFFCSWIPDFLHVNFSDE